MTEPATDLRHDGAAALEWAARYLERVDQLWDQSIHNYKLTETIDDPDVDEFDQYIFTVRRKFDWEHKYQETLVDIRSKPLKEALKHIMADV